jgi:hypothetical protein
MRCLTQRTRHTIQGIDKKCLGILISCSKLTGNFTYRQANLQHNRQCAYNATLRRVPATIFTLKKQYVLHILSVCLCVCVWNLSYQACNAHAPSVVCPALQYSSTVSDKRHHFREKKLTESKMCVVISYTTLVRNIFHSKEKWVRYDKNVYRSSCNVP